MRESDLVNALIRTAYPIVRLYRSNAGTFRSLDGRSIVHGMPKGFSDLFGVIPKDKTADGKPMPVFVEAKVGRNVPSPEQEAFLAEKRADGCLAGVCYSIDEMLDLLRPCLREGLLEEPP